MKFCGGMGMKTGWPCFSVTMTKTSATSSKNKIRDPITIPAIPPSESPLRWETGISASQPQADRRPLA